MHTCRFSDGSEQRVIKVFMSQMNSVIASANPSASAVGGHIEVRYGSAELRS